MSSPAPNATTSWEGKSDFDERNGPMVVSPSDLEAKASKAVLEAAGYGRMARQIEGAGDRMQDFFRKVMGDDGVLAPSHCLPQALVRRDLKAVTALIELGAAVDLQVCEAVINRDGVEMEVTHVTALTLAVMLDAERDRLRFLPVVAANGDLRQIDSNGRTLLHYAYSPVTVRYLMDAGLSLDTPDVHGETPRDHIPSAVLANVEQGWLARVLSAAGMVPGPQSRL
ncbi:hypothetical protein [Luteibacter aegosomatissinici]|uniref:hypothetical protein n=1 Tax=Luteibacter aegosomatissinici TaxID=2911539 RepID=UPI001FFAF3C7|nr:hypothetical protein [Luteibacter aegosomatissinici]UPG92795.1 hypothetical protein L2Y97_13065 [Luteibacter aegosomatissinici]